MPALGRSTRHLLAIVVLLTATTVGGQPPPKNPVAADKPNGDWAFRPIKSPAVPAVPEKHKAWVRNPVDAFVLDKLLANGLTPSRV